MASTAAEHAPAPGATRASPAEPPRPAVAPPPLPQSTAVGATTLHSSAVPLHTATAALPRSVGAPPAAIEAGISFQASPQVAPSHTVQSLERDAVRVKLFQDEMQQQRVITVKEAEAAMPLPEAQVQQLQPESPLRPLQQEPQSQVVHEPLAEPEAAPVPDTEPTLEPEAEEREPGAKGAVAATGADAEQEPEKEVMAEPGMEQEPEAAPEPVQELGGPESDPAAGADARIEAEADLGAEEQPEIEAEAEPGSGNGPAAEAEPQPEQEAEPEPQQEQEAEPEPQQEQGGEAECPPELEVEPDAGVEAAAQSSDGGSETVNAAVDLSEPSLQDGMAEGRQAQPEAEAQLDSVEEQQQGVADSGSRPGDDSSEAVPDAPGGAEDPQDDKAQGMGDQQNEDPGVEEHGKEAQNVEDLNNGGQGAEGEAGQQGEEE